MACEECAEGKHALWLRGVLPSITFPLPEAPQCFLVGEAELPSRLTVPVAYLDGSGDQPGC
eukprot:6876879-Alexandrium_andersonii.AAC.1